VIFDFRTAASMVRLIIREPKNCKPEDDKDGMTRSGGRPGPVRIVGEARDDLEMELAQDVAERAKIDFLRATAAAPTNCRRAGCTRTLARAPE